MPGQGAPLQIETDYQYDPFGHPYIKTVKPSDAAARMTTTTYTTNGEFVAQVVNVLGQIGRAHV